MAVRTIPAMVHYGRLIADTGAARVVHQLHESRSSIITQAVAPESDARLIGICDTPMEMFEDAAHALGLPAVGVCLRLLRPQPPRLAARGAASKASRSCIAFGTTMRGCCAAYRSPLFEPERLRELRLLPTEYLYYYYRPDVALAHVKRAGSSRGRVVGRAHRATLPGPRNSSPQAPKPQALARYERYLADRDASYMQIETGSSAKRVKPAWAELSGYDRIALMTMRAIVHNQSAIIPLDVANRGNTAVPRRRGHRRSAVRRRTPTARTPLHVGARARSCARPDHAGEDYERATVRRRAHRAIAAICVDALALNPLVPSDLAGSWRAARARSNRRLASLP